MPTWKHHETTSFVQPTGVNSMLHRPDLQAFRCNASKKSAGNIQFCRERSNWSGQQPQHTLQKHHTHLYKHLPGSPEWAVRYSMRYAKTWNWRNQLVFTKVRCYNHMYSSLGVGAHARSVAQVMMFLQTQDISGPPRSHVYGLASLPRFDW